MTQRNDVIGLIDILLLFSVSTAMHVNLAGFDRGCPDFYRGRHDTPDRDIALAQIKVETQFGGYRIEPGPGTSLECSTVRAGGFHPVSAAPPVRFSVALENLVSDLTWSGPPEGFAHFLVMTSHRHCGLPAPRGHEAILH